MSPCPIPPDDDDDDDCLIEAEMEVEDPDLNRYQAETDRLRVLVEFVQRPPYLPALADGRPSDDAAAALDLAAVEACQAIRRIAAGSGW